MINGQNESDAAATTQISSKSCPTEPHQHIISALVGDACNFDPTAGPEGVFHDLGLLLDPIVLERLTGFEAVIIFAERMAVEHQIPPTARLCLPHMRQFVDQMPLTQDADIGKVITIRRAIRVKMEVPLRSHRYVTGLKQKPFAALYLHRAIIDRIAKDPARNLDFARRERPLTPDRARWHGWAKRGSNQALVQRSSPAARISASNLWVRAPTILNVPLTLPPGFRSADGSITMM